jgi:hypothetical protein
MDRIALFWAGSRQVSPYIKSEMRAALIVTTHAPTVNALARFNALLAMIEDLPKNLQGEPLAALGARIPRFPTDDQQPAINAFLARAHNLPKPRPALLVELVEAATQGPEGLKEREKAAAADGGPARVSVSVGENVEAVCQRDGITDPAAIFNLEWLSVDGPAGEEVRNGASVTATAEKYGIRGETAINRLESLSVDGPAGEKVRKGASVTATAKKYGIRGEAPIRRLERHFNNRPEGAA